MSATTNLRAVVLRCRERLREGRIKIREQHDSGSAGIQVSTRIADLYDEIVLDIWNEATKAHLGDIKHNGLALVAHGGFGRRDLAPFSDADIMLIATRDNTSLASKIAGTLSRDLVDAGLQLGFSIRTPSEAVTLAWSDPIIFSSLTESRFLAGGLQVYSGFFQNLRQGTKRRRQRILRDLIGARREERHKWGETNYLLRPNVKRSLGGLRDIQLIRWIGFIKYGETDLERLLKLGALPSEDYRLVRQAFSFMLRLRNELHFRENRSQDILDRPTQMLIAEAWGYKGTEGVLPVEQFMQAYFEHTQNVRCAASFFADDAHSRPLISRAYERVLSREIEKNIRMGPTNIWVTESALHEFASSLPDVLRLMSLANEHRRRIDQPTWHAIREVMLQRQPAPPDDESIAAFLSLLSRGSRLADLLRRLHELRVLEQLIPGFKRTRGLLQFNAYHKYTVDAHCILAVEAACDFEQGSSAISRRYRRLTDKRLLHLSLLIHDLGKGCEGDHEDVGREIALDTAKLLHLDEESTDTLAWLVHKHLLVNLIAFRHDLNDSEIVHRFAAEVGSIRRLELLIVHTVADLTAVGPGVLTDWKMNLIEDLYLRTRRYFETGDLPGDQNPEIDAVRNEVRKHLDTSECYDTCLELLNDLPLSLLRRGEPNELAGELTEIAGFLASGPQTYCASRFDPSMSAVRYTIVRREGEQTIGTFARATGALSTAGLAILRAEIETVGDWLAWDDFWVTDPDFPDEPPEERRNEISDRIRHLLDTPDAPLPPHRKTWTRQGNKEPQSVNVLPTKVMFDNDTFRRYTILSIFAYDQVGLLYRIAWTLAQHRVVLHFAKIDTHLDQIADVFYISEIDGQPILELNRQNEIRDALLAVVSNA